MSEKLCANENCRNNNKAYHSSCSAGIAYPPNDCEGFILDEKSSDVVIALLREILDELRK